LPEPFVSRTTRSTTPSRRHVRERRVGERLGESECLGDLLPEPPPFSFDDLIATR
jgi:hypothetical protein